MLKNLLQMHLKLLQKERFKKTAEATGDLIGNRIAIKIPRAAKMSPINNSDPNEEKLRERFIPSELRHKIINDLRLKKKNY